MYFSDTVDFLKSISPRMLPGVQELQRRDLLHRASDLAFEEHITEDEEEFEDEGKMQTKYSRVPNKRSPPNKHSPWKFCQKQ